MFKLLSTFKNHHTLSAQGSSPFLARLLLRLDYNNFLTNLSEQIEQEKNNKLLADYHQNITQKKGMMMPGMSTTNFVI
jgi:hypothetical protein